MYKVLIVDDSPTVVKILKYSFESDECVVLTADNGIDALKIARSEMPDLMILDLTLPGIDGFHVCATIKRDPRFTKIKVLLLTGSTDEDSKELGIKCGADKYVTKDREFDEIIMAAKKMLIS